MYLVSGQNQGPQRYFKKGTKYLPKLGKSISGFVWFHAEHKMFVWWWSGAKLERSWLPSNVQWNSLGIVKEELNNFWFLAKFAELSLGNIWSAYYLHFHKKNACKRLVLYLL